MAPRAEPMTLPKGSFENSDDGQSCGYPGPQPVRSKSDMTHSFLQPGHYHDNYSSKWAQSQLPPTPSPSEGTTSAPNSPFRPNYKKVRVEDESESSEDSRAGLGIKENFSPLVAPIPSPEPSPALTEEPESYLTSSQRRTKSHPIRTAGPHDSEPSGPRSQAHAKIHTYIDGAERHAAGAFPRISKPVELLRSSYDVVVIGSGYGGGVAASRMARAGESVCVLERGQERWPGEYPTGAREALEQLHFSGEFSPYWLPGKTAVGGDPTGMYHLILGRGQNAVVGNGLGGTSLINANVFLEADADTMAKKAWPPQLREKDALAPYYKRVRKVLEPEIYPDDWPELPKARMLKKQAEHLNMSSKFRKVEQTTRFRNGPNSCGVEMSPSALTGQDATGVNDGSKTTTLVTYLADAWNWGAEMFCECEVRHIEKVTDSRGGYIIYFAWHGRNRGCFASNLRGDLMWVHAKNAVFLGAGAIGTTEILLRSRAMGLETSSLVGQNMSGNGDILAFGYNTDEEVNAVGRVYPDPYNPVGPCITSIIDNREGHPNPLDGFVIQEGTVPRALAHLFQAMLDFMPGSQSPKDDTIIERTQAALARWGSRILGPYFRRGAVERTQVYLVMSHDTNQAVLSLKNDRPVLEFLGVGRGTHVKEINQLLAKATEAVGGTLVQTPFFALMGEQQVTVHPIGGASMARDNTGATGVTDHKGEVFMGSGSETHKGLIVTDGALIPAALGANPLATIAAIAERCVEIWADECDLEISEEKNGILDLFGEPAHVPRDRQLRQEVLDIQKQLQRLPRAHTIREVLLSRADSVGKAEDAMYRAKSLRKSGFGFTEVMSGFIHKGANMREDVQETYELAYRTAKSLCENARFFLSVQTLCTKDMVQDYRNRGMLTGTFICPTIPGSPFMVKRGEFGLFVRDHKAPGTRNLTYNFDMMGINGEVLHFHGYKVVDSSVALSPGRFWRSTTTLYVTITNNDHPPHIDPGDIEAWRHCSVVARGIMSIQPKDFWSEMLTLSPTGSSFIHKAKSAASFMSFFTRKSLSLLVTPFTPLQYPSRTYVGYVNDTLPTQSFKIVASDGVTTRLHMWEATHTSLGPDGKPTPAKNLFMIPGAAVDHQIFALPTIPYNAVNYFTRAGYRVFVTVHRIGQLMSAKINYTTYDARLDLKACLEYIRRKYPESGNPNKPSKIYTIAHCMGSVAFASGLLDGTIPSDWILGITCSQVFMNPIWGPSNMAKVMAGPIPMDTLYRLVAGNWFSCSTGADDAFVQRLVNQALRLMPDSRSELCNSASCHRTSLVFGRCWNHRNLNEATHRQIDRFFGGVNMTLLHLLMKMGSEGHVMGNAPLCNDLTTPANIQRLRGIPFLLFSGRDNAVLSIEATERTYEKLTDTFGGMHYPRRAADDDTTTSSAAVTPQTGAPDSGIEYRRRVVPGYGHLDCWMGRNAWKDIYPFVREEVDRVVRGERYKFEEPDDKFKAMVRDGDLLC